MKLLYVKILLFLDNYLLKLRERIRESIRNNNNQCWVCGGTEDYSVDTRGYRLCSYECFRKFNKG